MAGPHGLYQEMILEHNKKPRNFGELPEANRRAEGVNPVCGDHIQLGVKVEDERITGIAFTGESCAICKASCSMMTTMVKGKSLHEAETLIGEFRALATGSLDPAEPHHLGRLTIFSGISQLPSRVKCAVLPWHTLHSAVSGSAHATTEGTSDPTAITPPPSGPTHD